MSTEHETTEVNLELEHLAGQILDEHDRLFSERPETPGHHSVNEYIRQNSDLDPDNLPTGRIFKNKVRFGAWVQASVLQVKFNRDYHRYEEDLTDWRQRAADSADGLSGVFALLGRHDVSDAMHEQSEFFALPDGVPRSARNLGRLIAGKGSVIEALDPHEEMEPVERLHHAIDLYKFAPDSPYSGELLNVALVATRDFPMSRVELAREAMRRKDTEAYNKILEYTTDVSEDDDIDAIVSIAIRLVIADDRKNPAKARVPVTEDLERVVNSLVGPLQTEDLISAFGRWWSLASDENKKKMAALKALAPMMAKNLWSRENKIRKTLDLNGANWLTEDEEEVLLMQCDLGIAEGAQNAKAALWDKPEHRYRIFRGLLNSGEFATAHSLVNTLPTKNRTRAMFELTAMHLEHTRIPASFVDQLAERTKIPDDELLMLEVDTLLYDSRNAEEWSRKRTDIISGMIDLELSDGLDTRSDSFVVDLNARINRIPDAETRKEQLRKLRQLLESDRRQEVQDVVQTQAQQQSQTGQTATQ